MEDLLGKRLAYKSSDGEYVAIVDAFGDSVRYYLYKMNRMGIVHGAGGMAAVDFDAAGPSGSYRLVASGFLAKINEDGRINADGETVEHFIARERDTQHVDTWVKHLEFNRQTQTLQGNVQFLEFVAGATPFVAATDHYNQGDWGNFAISLSADLALLLTGPAASVARAGNAVRIAQVVRYTGMGLEAVVGTGRSVQGLYGAHHAVCDFRRRAMGSSESQ